MAGDKNSGQHGGRDSSYSHNFTFIAPDWLSDIAKEYWDRNIKVLVDNNCIADKDYDEFCRLCVFYAKWRACIAVTSKDGDFYETETDRGAARVMKRPEAVAEMDLHKIMIGLEKKFGLNPADGKAAGFGTRDKKKSVRNKYGDEKV